MRFPFGNTVKRCRYYYTTFESDNVYLKNSETNANIKKMGTNLDPREVLQYLNELGYCNVTATQLKEFMRGNYFDI